MDVMILHIESFKDAIKKLQRASVNLRKMQDAKLIYRNLSHFYTLTMNYKNEKLGRESHLQSHQIEKIKKIPSNRST